MKTPQDPGTWPALVHRLTSSWSALLRSLVALAIITAVLAITWYLLGLSSVHVGPVEIHQYQQHLIA
ncbi:hypothetical protein SAMN04488564_12558 [Lentzea waywayandensis]|uniref:Uncharacterized protein n=1 Tax=Lentzea waywayandensis TaxID=84724 RepID=A0A1I6FJ91_9PSEU|nr:hypothetical protein [Lentzea waywayandensis]SFR30006.1 hypothetical protein SAMN04488564_12558 [Lentzea waywayandensis]